MKATQRSHVCGRCCRGGREPLCAGAAFLGDAGLNGGTAEYVALDADGVVGVPDGVGLHHASIAACAIGTVGTPVLQPARRPLAQGGRWVLVGRLTLAPCA